MLPRQDFPWIWKKQLPLKIYFQQKQGQEKLKGNNNTALDSQNEYVKEGCFFSKMTSDSSDEDEYFMAKNKVCDCILCFDSECFCHITYEKMTK